MGPTGSVLPFIGTCAHVALAAGDQPGARRLMAQFFEMCRVVEWMYFGAFADLYVALAMAEGRLEAAAHLLGYAQAETRRDEGLPHRAAKRDTEHATLAMKLAPERLAALLGEGAGLSRESVCSRTLEAGKSSTQGMLERESG